MSSNELKKDIKRAAKKVLPDPAIRKIRAYRKTRKGSEPKPNTYRSSQTYTVVTAVYNVEAYLMISSPAFTTKPCLKKASASSQ